MNSKHSAKTQQTVIDRIMKENVPVGMIVEETSIPRSTIYYWVKRHNDRINRKNNEISLKSYRLLENKVARLEGIIKILKTVECTVKDPLEIKLSELEKLHGKYNVHMLCEALDVSRGSFYNHILRNKRENTWYVQRRTELRDKIQQVYDDNYQIFGATKICAVMKEEGYHVSVEMVRELMRDMGLISVRKGAKGLYEKEKRSFSNHINKQFTASAPNQVWVSDVTCYKLNDKTFYICVIIDLYARFVVGYKISKNCSTHLTKGTFRKAYENRNTPSGLIFHSDRGGNYIANTFEAYLKSLNVTHSFSRTGAPTDNAVIESFFSHMKQEELYRTKYRSEYELNTAVENYIEFYNNKRPHKNNKYKTPQRREYDYFNNNTDI